MNKKLQSATDNSVLQPIQQELIPQIDIAEI